MRKKLRKMQIQMDVNHTWKPPKPPEGSPKVFFKRVSRKFAASRSALPGIVRNFIHRIRLLITHIHHSLRFFTISGFGGTPFSKLSLEKGVPKSRLFQSSETLVYSVR